MGARQSLPSRQGEGMLPLVNGLIVWPNVIPHKAGLCRHPLPESHSRDRAGWEQQHIVQQVELGGEVPEPTVACPSSHSTCYPGQTAACVI
jgi:hypothetical protein